MPTNVKNKPFQPRTLAQNRKIWALKSELHLDEETLRSAVETITGERSISRLSREQAGQVIEHLEGKKPNRHKQIKTSSSKASSSNKTDRSKTIVLMITPKQRVMINSLVSQVRWQYEDGFERFLKKRFGIESLKTNGDVTKVKKALENIIYYQHLNKGALE